MSYMSKKVVNTEEQNRTVNPGDDNTTEETAPAETPVNNTGEDKSGETERSTSDSNRKNS